MLDPNRLRHAREAFTLSGISVADWARQNRFSAPLVYAVLQGKNQATRGESHRIAVALGIKPAPQEPLLSLLCGGSITAQTGDQLDSDSSNFSKETIMS